MIHTIKNSFLQVSAAEKGAQLQSVRGADGTEYLWQGDSKYWPDRALNIFPYVARLTDGCYYLDGKRYSMDIHGIAPYRQFRLVENNGERMTLELASDPQTLLQYPREFVFRVIYALRDNVLEVTYEVRNRDEKTMYFGLGGHPGFNVPLTEGGKFEDYSLQFSPSCQPNRVCFSEDCFVTGQLLPYPLEAENSLSLRHSLFDQDAIVLTDVSHQVTLAAKGDPHSVTVTYPGMDYLGLWHWPKTDAPYICIEPWCSLPAREDAVTVLEEQDDLICLAPGKVYTNSWTIEVQ